MLLKIIVLIIIAVLGLFYAYLLITVPSKYDGLIKPLEGSSFPLKEVYGVGFRLLDIIKFKYSSKNAVRLRREAVVLYGDKFGDYYVRVFYAQRISLAYSVLVVISILAGLSGGENLLILFVLGVVMAGTVYYYFMQQSYNTIQKLSRKYIMEFPSIVSTMALLVNAGMVLRDAWDTVAFSGETEMHKQMQKVTEDRNNGFSEADSLSAMARRCATPEISKFVSMTIQALERSGEDLAATLRNQSDEMWELKQQKLLQEGEKASGKLLIPIMIMFVGVLVMIMMPIMTNLGI